MKGCSVSVSTSVSRVRPAGTFALSMFIGERKHREVFKPHKGYVPAGRPEPEEPEETDIRNLHIGNTNYVHNEIMETRDPPSLTVDSLASFKALTS